MTPKERAVMQQALEALERWRDWDDWNNTAAWGLDDEDTITALREALAEQAEQEPVGWTHAANLVDDGYGHIFSVYSSEPAYDDWIPLYAAPVRTKDLTDDEKWAIFTSKDWTGEPLNLIDAVIAADREKNNVK